MDAPCSYLAVDLGAGSGRVILGRFADEGLRLEELHRFEVQNRPVDGHDRWDFGRMLAEIVTGLRAARDQVLVDPASIRSVGVDSWGVDFGLLDEAGVLLGDPVCYRDQRTDGVLRELLRRVPASEIYGRTGIQFMPFNTVVQLLAQVAAGEWPEAAHRFLMVPDLVHRHLSGVATGEFTNATTTQLLNAEFGVWDERLLSAVGVPLDVMPPLVTPGTRLGGLTPELRNATGLETLEVVIPATHDTASAVAGTPLEDGWAYLSSGTWSLLGVEIPSPVLTELAHRHNFTNEGGVSNTFRLLKNVMGLWLLESCRRSWDRAEKSVSHAELAAGLRDTEPGHVFLQPDELRFLHPDDMVAEIRSYLEETGQRAPDDPIELTRIVLESLALRYACVVKKIQEVTGQPVRGIHIVGGGSRNSFLNQATASATGLPVRAGPTEATAIGNLLVQGIGDGALRDLAEAREFVARAMPHEEFLPRAGEQWAEARERFSHLG